MVVHDTWYFLAPTSKLREFYNLLHLPYTGMVLAFVVTGAGLAPKIYPDRLLATLLAYLLGLGVAAHAFDQLEPRGSHYVQHLTRAELVKIGAFALFGAIGLGAYYAITLSPFLLPFIGVGVFFAFAYPLPSYIAGGRFHNNLSFAFSWGFLPFLTSYYVNSLSITPQALLFGVPMALVASMEIVLSRYVRKARREGLPKNFYEAPEIALKLLTVMVYSLATGFLLWRLT